MKFRKTKTAKELEIVSLIDVVFLLIIFGLVMTVYVASGEDPGEKPSKMLRIELWRMSETDEQGETESWTAARFVDADGNLVSDTAHFPPDAGLGRNRLDDAQFEQLDACRLISRQLGELIQTIDDDDGTERTNTIHVVVAADTRVRIVSFIATECMPFHDRVKWLRLETEKK